MAFNFSPKIITDGLVYYLDAANSRSYPGSGTIWTDISKTNRSSSLVNGPSYSSINGGTVVFDGSNDYVSLGTFTNLGITNRTYSMWFRVTSLPASSGRIMVFPADDTATDTPAFVLGITSGGVLVGGLGGSPYDGYNLNIPYTLNSWVNIVATISTKTITFYKNTVSLGSNTSTGIVATNPIGYLGRYNGNYGQYLTGNISIIQIYNRVLSTAEITYNYNILKTRFGL